MIDIRYYSFRRDEKNHQRLWLNRWFFCDRWSRNRCVTSMDWSPQFPELLAASYNNNDDTPNDPDGVCLVWNTKFKKTTPEFIFHCQSPVMSTTFARFHPNLILGGTYSGQIVLWDNRVQKRTPIQRTPLSASAHTVSYSTIFQHKYMLLLCNIKNNISLAPCVLFKRCWGTKRAQFNKYIDRWKIVFLEFRHVVTTARNIRSSH